MLNKGKYVICIAPNQNKGITLIALIITIIVMLILVGVTVNVAMQGGLFSTANKASSETTRQIEKDQLISAVLGGLQTGGIFDATAVQLPADMKWCDENDNDYDTATEISAKKDVVNAVITKTNNKFYVDEDGNVLDKYKSEIYASGKKFLGGAKFTLNSNITKPTGFTITDTGMIIESGEEIYSDDILVAIHSQDDDVVIETFIGLDDNKNLYICVDDQGNARSGINYVYLFDGTDYTISGNSYSESGWYMDDNQEEVIYEKITTLPEFGGTDFPELIVDADDDKALERANKYLSDVFVKK